VARKVIVLATDQYGPDPKGLKGKLIDEPKKSTDIPDI
jgi:hypothetical protein